MNKEELIYTKEDFEEFRKWLRLNMEGVTWQGRFKNEFEKFWDLFFLDGLSISQVMDRFEYAISISKVGPLASWFNWLKEKLLSYTFIFKNITVFQLAKEGQVTPSLLGSILRSFFLDAFPHYDDYLSTKFQIGNTASDNLFVTFSELEKEIEITNDILGSQEDEIMPSMEVTLYEEWSLFLKRMEKELYHNDFNFKTIKSNASLKKQFKLLIELIVLLTLGVLVTLAVIHGNKWYEKLLADKISIYEPQLKWLDKTLTFKPVEDKPTVKFELNLDDIEKAENKAKKFGNVSEDNIFNSESEVVLTSWDSLPKDFDVADLELSDYEELGKRGYREYRFGNTKVYRVMMKSVNSNGSREKLNKLLLKYSVKQVDNVKPGLAVPGGFYYNLYVPRKNLKEFMAQMMDIDESILYESRARTTRNPPGMNRVFVWIKSL
jgi:hypothetical protein